MGWSAKYKKSINCDNPKGFSQRAHCQGRKKKMKEAKDHEVAMAQSQLKNIEKNVKSLKKKLGTKEKDIPAWMQDKISKTHHNMSAVGEYHTEEGLRDWFGKSKSKDGKKGWVNVVTGDSCASDKPGEGIPKCVSSAKRASMSKKERLAAQRAKRREDPGQQKKSGAAAPTMVKTDRKTKKEEVELVDAYGNTFATIQDIIKPEPMQATNCPRCGQNPCVCAPSYDIEAMTEAKDKKGKGSGTKDACYHKVKSRYSVWPSAYASGALVKCRKVGAANWGNKSEGFEYELNDEYYDNLFEKCWKGYEKKGMKTMFGKRYPNCVKKEEVETVDEGLPNPKVNYLKDMDPYDRRRQIRQHAPGSPLPPPVPGLPDMRLRKAKAKTDKKVQTAGYQPEGEMIDEKVQRYNELGQTVAVTLRFRGKIFYLQLFFPTVKFPNRKEVEAQVQKIYPDAVVMMAVPATVDPTKPTIRVAEEVLQEKPGDGYLGPTPIPNPIRMAQDAVDSTNRANQRKVDTVNKILGRNSASMPKHSYFNKDTSPAYKKYFGGGVKEEVLPDGPAPDKRNPQKPKRKTQGGDVRPGIKEQSVPVTAYNKGDRFTGRAGAMTPKEIERANEGSANRIRKTIKLANSHEPEGEMLEENPLLTAIDKTLPGRPFTYQGFKDKYSKPYKYNNPMTGPNYDKSKTTATQRREYAAGGGNAAMRGRGQTADQVRSQGRKNLAARPPNPNVHNWKDGNTKVYAGNPPMRFNVKNSFEPEGEMVEGAAWTKKSGKNPSGGLNEKGRKSYERENPGSDLKAPSKKVGNKRRASFCARMKGMKKKLTSAKTANDPDSRINKSLRAWNC